ncbi:hypothetical protein OC846_005297 [Tilletia horrida]|uniref:Uncharacterized protein n=1 Tax=Tilletia horrida TaxID=155126 RepID=A0AAN6GN81_9BASI|nr:hypothetical protein OC846_005297 [Tilletia horrida]
MALYYCIAPAHASPDCVCQLDNRQMSKQGLATSGQTQAQAASSSSSSSPVQTTAATPSSSSSAAPTAQPASSTSVAPPQSDPELTLQSFVDEAKTPIKAATPPDTKQSLAEKVEEKLEDGTTVVTDIRTVFSPLQDLLGALENCNIQLSDLFHVSQDVLNNLNQLAEWTTVAGPFLKIGLGVVAEILKIVQEVKENKDACEQFSEKVMDIFREFVFAAKASGCEVLPGSTSALILERAIQ